VKTVIVLAMHGAPPSDFPPLELAEWFALHQRMEQAIGDQRAALQQRWAQLEQRMRSWPRTPHNDRFHAHSLEMGSQLGQVTGLPVIVGFNEFCAPSLEEALERAVAEGARRVIVVTPMMTRGGEHAERDIPAAIQLVQMRHSEVNIVYAWPFDGSDVACFLAARIDKVL
jgi:sirohydrochlorin cobaltochelatase